METGKKEYLLRLQEFIDAIDPDEMDDLGFDLVKFNYPPTQLVLVLSVDEIRQNKKRGASASELLKEGVCS